MFKFYDSSLKTVTHGRFSNVGSGRRENITLDAEALW